MIETSISISIKITRGTNSLHKDIDTISLLSDNIKQTKCYKSLYTREYQTFLFQCAFKNFDPSLLRWGKGC